MLTKKTPWLILLATAALTLSASVGCDSSASTTQLDTPPPAQGNNSEANNSDPEGESTVMNGGIEFPEDNTDEIPAPPNPGLGEEEGQPLIPVGMLNGIWRLGTDDVNDVPVGYLSVVHDKDAAVGTCSYEMSLGASPQFDGRVGSCDSVTWKGEVMTVTFNPTNDSEEVWTVTTSQKVSDDQFKATITKLKDPAYSLKVNSERQLPTPGDDGVRPPTSGQ